MTVRAATAADVPRMREVAYAAKGHWVAECDGAVAAYASLLPPADGVCELDDLWVGPEFMGRGIGGALFAHAVGRARERGATAVRWEAEPNAVGFYERMGASVVGTAVGSWGRDLPVMRLELA